MTDQTDQNEWTSIIIDKCSGDLKKHDELDHSISNKITLSINAKELEYNSDTIIFNDTNAITFYKKYIRLPEIPTDLDTKLYNLIILKNKKNNIDICVSVLKINTTYLEELILNKKEIPNKSFLFLSLRYFDFYDKARRLGNFSEKFHTSGNMEDINKNIGKVIENAMNSSKYKRTNAIEDPKMIKTKLFDYQKCSVKWMLDREKNHEVIKYGNSHEIKLGNIYYEIDTTKFTHKDHRKKVTFYGGAIIDEVGLGKTLQITALGILGKPTTIDKVNKVSNMLNSKATLVLCPNTLAGQWKRELTNKIEKSYKPKIISILTKVHFEKVSYKDLIEADFVLVSFNLLDNKAFKQQWIKDLSTSQNYMKTNLYNYNIVQKVFDNYSKKIIADTKIMEKKQALFQCIHWNRLVVDEFHEVHSNVKNKHIENLLPHIKSTHRWVVSGTPFISNDSLTHMFNYITNYQNIHDIHSIFNNMDMIEFLCNDTFRRNTKESVEKEHTLPPIKEEVHLLKFSATERMMYNAFLANANNDPYSVYLRKLCCDPKLADETKHALSECKTMEDIEKVMVSQYKKEVNLAQTKLENGVKRVFTVLKNIRKLRFNNFKSKVTDELKKQDTSTKIASVLTYDIIPIQKTKYDYSKYKTLDEKEDEDKKDKDEYKPSETELKTLEKIINKVNKELNEKKTELATIKNALEQLENAENRFNILLGEYKGRVTTHDFFNNVVARIRTTAKKEKPNKKVEKEFDPSQNVMDFLDDDSDEESDEEDEDEETCGICLDSIGGNDIGVTKCGHIFHYSCLVTAITKAPKCPYCSTPINQSQIFRLNYEKKEAKKVLTPEELEIQKLVNKVGTKLAHLILYLKNTKKHSILFSQWDDLLTKIGVVLKEHGIKNVFCKGSVFQRDKAIREFNEDDKIKVIMLSSEKAASGTNLTKASQIILVDPVYGDYKYRRDTENQAIGRAHRLGQKERINVVRFVIKESIEEDIYKQNQIEDKKHNYDIERDEIYETI